MEDKKTRKKETKPRRAKGEGGLRFNEAKGLWIGTIERPRGADGKRRAPIEVTSKDKDKCMEKKRVKQREVEDGLDPVTSTTTVETWLNTWLTDIIFYTVGPGTHRTYRSTVKNQLIPTIGGRRLAKLTPADVRKMIKTVTDQTTTRTAEASFWTLSKALKAARNDGLIRENVCERVESPKALSVSRGSMDLPRVIELLRFIDADNDPRTARIAMALLTGARQAECIGLERRRINWTAGVLDIDWQLQRLRLQPGPRPKTEIYPREAFLVRPDLDFRPVWRGWCLIRPKSRTSTRIVPMIPLLQSALRNHCDRTPDHGTGLVWTRADGRPILDSADTAAWRHTLISAGIYAIDDEVPTLHAARHTLATVLQSQNVPEPVRMAIMGHSSVAAHRGYAHVDQTLTRAALGELGKLLT